MNQDTSAKNCFPAALKMARKARNVSQESFGSVTSRTYVSALERGIQHPTLNKVDELGSVLGIHPLTLVALSYLSGENAITMEVLMTKLSQELGRILAGSDPKEPELD